jgi:N-acetylmuramoyl-L-alanine amidase
VRLYRSGDEGEPVRDIQDRLRALGFTTEPDSRGRYGQGTESAVRSFQQARSLGVDGIVGTDTWRALVAAGYRLGQRPLYHRIPMMRGDDVADLQRRLNALGFDARKVDGIFGPDTLRAVLEFQANRRMGEDGIVSHDFAAELDLMSRATDKPGREVVRDHVWLENLPPTVAGLRIYVDAYCRDENEAAGTWHAALTLTRIIQDLGGIPVLSRSADTTPTERVRALRANRLGVDIIISLCLPHDGDPAVYYFASAHSRSDAGSALARSVGGRLGLPIEGRAVPMLKNTQSPAILVAAEPMDDRAAGKVAQGLIDLLASPDRRPPVDQT